MTQHGLNWYLQFQKEAADLQIGPSSNSLSKEQQEVVPSVAQNCKAKKKKKRYSTKNYQMRKTVCKVSNKQK